MRNPRFIILLAAIPFVQLLGGCGSNPTFEVYRPTPTDSQAYPDSSNYANNVDHAGFTTNSSNLQDVPGTPDWQTATSHQPQNGRIDSTANSLDATKYWGASANPNDRRRNSGASSFNHTGPNPNEPYLNLFGEIEGAGGLPGQFAATENIQQISFASEGADFDPCVDMTGEVLLYASTQHSGTADIYMKGVEGTTVTRLTSDPADDVMPAFSPDNQQIAFASNRSGNWDIYVMSADGGPPIQITDDPGHEIHPSWSPDGRQICYSRLSEQSGRWEMWVTQNANSAMRKFIGYGLFPEWCPDPAHNKIVYQQARERGSRLFSIWTIDIENGEGRRPTEIASATNAAAINPTWSADGRMIAFSTIVDPERQNPHQPGWADVWVIGLDGTGRANLTNGEYANLQPTWGPDGRIYFISNRSGIDNVWALSPTAAIKTARGGVTPSDMILPNTDTSTSRSDMAEVPIEP